MSFTLVYSLDADLVSLKDWHSEALTIFDVLDVGLDEPRVQPWAKRQ